MPATLVNIVDASWARAPQPAEARPTSAVPISYPIAPPARAALLIRTPAPIRIVTDRRCRRMCLPSGDKFVLIFVAPGLRAIRDSPTDRLWLAPPPSVDRVPRNEALE